MYDLHIRVVQGLSAAEGQEKLKQIMERVKKENTIGIGRIEVEGANVFGNPFPEWLVEQLTNAIPDLRYDEINYSYTRRFEDQAEAVQYLDWITKELLPSAYVQTDPAKKAVADKVKASVTMYLPEALDAYPDGY